LEQALAAFKGTEAALAFASGYATALGTLGALLDKDDVVVLDKLVHACVVDAARLCGAKLRVFAHNDLNDLEDILRWADQRPAPASPQATRRRPRVLIVTESVFSMDGDQAPLRELVRLKDQYGAWLMVDEAHATGVFGTQRRGVAEALGVADRIEIQMGTLGKALGTAGGFISGSRGLIDVLINRARSFIFSTAPPPAWAAAAQASLRFVQSPEGAARCAQLWTNVTTLRQRLPNGPWRRLACESPILPLVLGEERRAVELADALRTLGVFVPAIRYPAVARGQARLRLTVTASHSATDLATLCQALEGKS
jgi:8-amino-7-oxononanoate synthase